MSQPMPDVASATGDVCPQCGAAANWKSSSWCASCGYYPAIGRLVETPTLECEETVYENWWEAVPTWLWVLVGGVAVIFVTSVGVRVAFADSPVRMWWTVAQLFLGVVAFFFAHLLAYLHGASRSDRVGPLDAIMKPIATWQPVLRSLPEKVRLLWTGSWGLTAVLLAFFVIDGIDYQALAEARHAEEQPKQRANPMAFVIKSAQTVAAAQNALPGAGGDADSMEEALTDFTGATGLEDTNADALGEGDLAEVLRDSQFVEELSLEGGPGEGKSADGTESDADEEGASVAATGPDRGALRDPQTNGLSAEELESLNDSIECVVIGYTTNSAGEPRSLLLAALIHNRLRFVAKVGLNRVNPETLAGIPEQLPTLVQRRPVAASPFGGRWLRPELFCQVRHAGWTSNGRLGDPYIMQISPLTNQEAKSHDSTIRGPVQ